MSDHHKSDYQPKFLIKLSSVGTGRLWTFHIGNFEIRGRKATIFRRNGKYELKHKRVGRTFVSFVYPNKQH